MDKYCNYKDAFDNNNSDLDKMALDINNKRIKNNDKERLHYLMDNSSQNISFSDMKSDLDSNYENTNRTSYRKSDLDSNYENTNRKSDLDSNYGNISDLSSSYSDLSPKLKKNLRLTTKHLDMKDENKIINHIQTCDECKNELIKIMDIKHIGKKHKSKNTLVLITNDDIKNLIIVTIIGLIIIIIINKSQ